MKKIILLASTVAALMLPTCALGSTLVPVNPDSCTIPVSKLIESKTCKPQKELALPAAAVQLNILRDSTSVATQEATATLESPTNTDLHQVNLAVVETADDLKQTADCDLDVPADTKNLVRQTNIVVLTKEVCPSTDIVQEASIDGANKNTKKVQDNKIFYLNTEYLIP